MNNGIIDALLLRLFHGQTVTVRKNFLEAHADSAMTAGVFVKQRFIKQKTALIDRAFFRNKSHFTQHGCAFIHVKHLFQELLPFFRPAGYCFAMFKCDGEMINNLAVPGERLHGNQRSFTLPGSRRSKDFFCRHIGNIKSSVEHICYPCAFPLRFGNQINSKICAVCASIVQRSETLSIQPGSFLFDEIRMGFPLRHGIIIFSDTDCAKNSFP